VPQADDNGAWTGAPRPKSCPTPEAIARTDLHDRSFPRRPIRPVPMVMALVMIFSIAAKRFE